MVKGMFDLFELIQEEFRKESSVDRLLDVVKSAVDNGHQAMMSRVHTNVQNCKFSITNSDCLVSEEIYHVHSFYNEHFKADVDKAEQDHKKAKAAQQEAESITLRALSPAEPQTADSPRSEIYGGKHLCRVEFTQAVKTKLTPEQIVN